MDSPHSYKTFTPNPGDITSVECIDLDIRGNGISKWNDCVLVTPGLIPGEKANVKVLYKRGSQWFSKLISHHINSPNRRVPKCN